MMAWCGCLMLMTLGFHLLIGEGMMLGELRQTRAVNAPSIWYAIHTILCG